MDESKTSPLFSEDPFGQILTIISSLLVIYVAILGSILQQTVNQASQADSLAQQYALQAMGTKSSGQIEVGYAWTEAYRQWLEWDSKAKIAEQNGDKINMELAQKVRDRVPSLSPLLSVSYFDPKTDSFPNLRAYEANTYLVQTTDLQERYNSYSGLAAALWEKTTNYTNEIILLTVAMLILAIAQNGDLEGWRIRWLPTLLSMALIFYILISSINTYLAPVSQLPLEAIPPYAKGVGLSYQGDNEAAITAFNQALEIAPNYANAFYRRANTYFALGRYDKATADYEAAAENGREDVNVPWNLGWAYYLLGEDDKSIETTQAALALDDQKVALYFNLGMAYLAKGDLEEAKTAYQQGLDLGAEQVQTAKANKEEAPASLWWYLSSAIKDVDSFIMCVGTKTCVNAPPFETITVTDELKKTTQELRRTLKNNAVALEYLGGTASDTVASTISPLEFGTITYDAQGQVKEFTALGDQPKLRFGLAGEEEGEALDTNLVRAGKDAKPIAMRFNYENVPQGNLWTVKVYNSKNEESIWLRVAEPWTLADKGQATMPLVPSKQFALAPGTYRVEVYVQANLVQEGLFELK